MMCPDTGQFQILFLVHNILRKVIGLENSVIAMIGFDLSATGLDDPFESPFRDESVIRPKGDLMETLDISARVVTEDGTTGVLGSEGALSAPRRETTANRRLVLVKGDPVARREMVDFQEVFVVDDSGGYVGATMSSFRNLAGGAERRLTSASCRMLRDDARVLGRGWFLGTGSRFALVVTRPHETLNVGETEMAETGMPQKQFFLRGSDVLIRLIENGHANDTVSIAGSAGRWFNGRGGMTAIVVTGSFGKSDRKVGPWVDRTLEPSRVMVGVHPKVV